MLSSLEPNQKHLVFDLAEEAGFDMKDWIASSNDVRGPKANPKYCYEWAYEQPGKFIILNLWHANMVEEGGRIVQRENFRRDAKFHRANGKPTWAGRAQRLDDAIQVALRDNLAVRVIILAGRMRDKEIIDSKPSSVTYRELDPEPWTISNYDWQTGAHELTRGIVSGYVDQFDIVQMAGTTPERRDRTASTFLRDPAIRKRVLRRAAGFCELCGTAGFEMDRGAVYLETHHVVPLSEGGEDADHNVVALCANDHRRAHFAIERNELMIRLSNIAGKVTRGPMG